MTAETAIGYSYFDVEIEGTSPLLQHNGALSDPGNAIVKEMRKITGKKKKVGADHEELANLEFKGSLYVQNGKITIPPRLLESVLVEGARVSKEGQIALSSAFVEPDVVFTFDGPQTVEERIEDPESRLVVGVRVQRNRVMRCRPIFRNWSVKFQVSILSSTATEEMVRTWLTNAGALKGLGDWRPRYGRFELKSLA